MMMKWLKRVRVRLGNDKGFTLVELLVVVGILGLLASIGVPAVKGAMDKARASKNAADLALVQSAVSRYYIDKGVWPTSTGSAGTIDSTKLVPEYISGWPQNDGGSKSFHVKSDGVVANGTASGD